jgi:hypothetical protein
MGRECDQDSDEIVGHLQGAVNQAKWFPSAHDPFYQLSDYHDPFYQLSDYQPSAHRSQSEND